MKKLYVSLFVLVSFLLPLKAFAAVDITVADKSTTTQKSASISVDSGTDSLSSVTMSIEGSTDITFSEVNTGTVACSDFTNTINESIINITCTFDEAANVDGIIANVLFTTDQEDYSIKVLEDKVEIGDLTLGNVVNIEETTPVQAQEETEPTTLVAETTDTKKDGVNILGIDIMEYLPYILLGGSVILLISIIGVLVTKKKDKDDSMIPSTDPFVESNAETKTVTKEPTLKDMVNLNTPAPDSSAQNIPAVTQPIQSTGTEENDLKDLVAKEEVQEPTMNIPTIPPVEEKPAEMLNAMSSSLSMPMTTEEIVPDIASTPSPMQTSAMETTNLMPEVNPVTETPMEEEVKPIEIPTEPTESQAPIDLQQLVNNEIEQIPPEAIAQPSTPVQPPTPAVNNTEEEDSLPPVPPQM
ncbi:MAG: hypothetical protein AB9915_01400 [Candidatus Dojkabacteria bacterium]